MRDVVHEYYSRTFPEFRILVRVNPVDLSGLELTLYTDGKREKRVLQFDEQIEDDLREDGFERSGAMEFNLYLKGMI